MNAAIDDCAGRAFRPAGIPVPRIVGVGTAVSPTTYSQRELLDELRIDDPRIESVFLNSAIERRALSLPARQPDGGRAVETQGDLLGKHVRTGLAMGTAAIKDCLAEVGAATTDVRYLCCVTSTGFTSPGFSAMLIKLLGLDRHCTRLDVVGMGCNAGLNALTAVADWSAVHPGELALMVCVEACSAAYVFDGTMRSSVVNSLFGDGAAAVALRSGPGAPADCPGLIKFSSCLIPDAIDAMRYDWDEGHGKFSFYLDPEVPYVVGAHAELAVLRLLDGTGLTPSDITHWIVHSGGKKVIDSVRLNLGLSRYDVRHTIGVLRDHGNVSSGSFLFSYERLCAERRARPGDYGIFMTMGPGSTIEAALVGW